MAQPPDIAEHRWQVKPDVKASASAYEYWYNGGVDNLSAFLAYCYKLGGGERPVAVPAPQQHVVKGIYHPGADRPFESLGDYLAWYRARRLVPDSAPLAGILFYQTNYKVHDLEHIDALIAALEKRGIGAVPVFGWPVPELAPLLGEPGRSPLRLLYSFNLGFSQASDSETLERYGLHVIDLMTSRDSYETWSKSAFGITPERLSTQVALPEIAGATEPIVVGTTEKAAGVAGPVTKPIPERIEMAVSRGARWLALQDKPNAEKRIGLLYFNNPPGKGNIGASYLNVFPTLVAVLARLRESGYQTGGQLPTEKELEALLEISGRNIETMGARRVGSAGGEGPRGVGIDEEVPGVVPGAAQAVPRLRECGLGTAREVAVDDHHVARRREVLRGARRSHGQHLPRAAAPAHHLRTQHGDGAQHRHPAAALLHRRLSLVPQRIPGGRRGSLRKARHSGIPAGQERRAGRMGQFGGDPGRSAERVLLHHGRRRRIDHGEAAQRGGDDQPPDADGGGRRRPGPVRGAAADLREPGDRPKTCRPRCRTNTARAPRPRFAG